MAQNRQGSEAWSLSYWLLRVGGIVGGLAASVYPVAFVLLASAAESVSSSPIEPLFAILPETEARRMIVGLLLVGGSGLLGTVLFLMGYLRVAAAPFALATLLALLSAGGNWWLPYAALTAVALVSYWLYLRADAAQRASDSLLNKRR